MKVNSDNFVEIEVNELNSEKLIKPIAAITLSNSKLYDNELSLAELTADCKKITLDFSLLSAYDSYLIIFINEFEDFCKSNDIQLELRGISDDLNKFISILKPKRKGNDLSHKSSFWFRYFSNIGELIRIIFSDLFKLLEFIGELTRSMFTAIFNPKAIRWKDLPVHLMNAGVNAVPITILIVFLIGLISGYQGALQLSQFGADIYLADLIGISITRELSPLMVAIIVAGRSGSAFAAEIGTMKVSEEIDALTTMGFDRTHFLVLPRVIAVAVSMPILVIICDVAGIAGGLIAGLTTLDITISSFLTQLNIALTYSHVFSGILKSVVFGLLIATIGCFRGFQVQGGAESVGKYTTASVVSGVFLVILVDALFVFLFTALGI